MTKTTVDLDSSTTQHLCKVGRLLNELDEVSRNNVNVALAHDDVRRYPVARIAKALSKSVEYVSDGVVRLHKERRCMCFR